MAFMRHQILPASRFFCSCFLSLLSLAGSAQAGRFQGEAKTFDKEQCVILYRFPGDAGAKYRENDTKKEQELCGISFDDKGIGICPKTWSTSPGTIVYDIRESKYNSKPDTFEAEYCPQQRALKGKSDGVEKLASFKPSINGQFHERTSATYSQASPLYYHFSRYLNVTLDIPVAVMRTMDAQNHLHRVAVKGLATAQGKMNKAGWNVVISAEKNPAGYVPINEFYYGDPKDDLFYGAMLKGRGARYGAEFNGNISGKGYTEQYAYLQKTPAFVALASPKSLLDAMTLGIDFSKKDPVVAKALGPDISNEQMMFWMEELSEILIMDYIFSQQDRPGNIDYIWVWYYVTGEGDLKSVRVDSEVNRPGMGSIQVSGEVKNSSKRYLIQKTQINDNDAGGRKYSNFTKKFGLLEKIRHLNAVTYRQLIHLAKDFEAMGPLYKYLRDTFYISDSNADVIKQNVIQAAQILRSTCKAGTMKFDLNPETYLGTQKVEEVQVDCDNP